MNGTGCAAGVPPVVAEVLRGRASEADVLVESRIRGTVVGLGPDGTVELSVGDPGAVISPRSTVKPMQAVGMLTAGLDRAFDPGGRGIPPELLAIVCSSHSGEPAQLAAVRAVLAAVGRTPADLACPPDLPLGRLACERHLAAGGGPEPLLMNCSGKHAGMIACCVASGWPVDGYREPDHPLQRRIRASIEELVGGPAAGTAVDGCGAPLFGIPLVGLARGMRRIALAASEPPSPRQRVAAAMRTFPDRVGGPGRTDTELMLAVPWIIAKDGAEGVSVAATASGHAAAVKIEDGSQRAAMPVLVAALRRLGAFHAPDAANVPDVADLAEGAAVADVPGVAAGVDGARLAAIGVPKVLGGGVEVGRLRAFLAP